MALTFNVGCLSFSGPAFASALSPSGISMKAPGEIGVTPPCALRR